jgi:hypothetical protein
MLFGDMRLMPLADGQTATVIVEPAGEFDCGGGPGVRVEREARGGTVGLILDARGRPLALPDEREAARGAMSRWIDSLALYPETRQLAGAQAS